MTRKMFLSLAFAGLVGLTIAAPSARAADSAPSTDIPELRSVRADIKAKKYAAALTQLKVLVVKYQTADVYNLYGHALWKTGDATQGMAYYEKALAMDPSHKGALEYQGQLFVALGQIDKAKANLARLNRICLFGCEEYDDLKAAIERAPKKG